MSTGCDELLKNGGGTAREQEEIQAVLRAATNFRKAEVLLKKNNLGAAEEHAFLAVQDDPRQADYVALHTWIVSLKPGMPEFQNEAAGSSVERICAL